MDKEKEPKKLERVVKKPSDIEKYRTNEGENSFDFTGITFKCEMDFSGQEIEKSTFVNTKFNNDVTFKKVIFKCRVNFKEACFEGSTDFSESVFLEDLSFRFAKFNGEVNFYFAKFSRPVDFFNTRFKDDIDFSYVNFSESFFIKDAKFKKFVDFEGSMFSKSANFDNVQFLDGLDISNSRFLEKVSYNNVKFFQNTYFHKTKFANVAYFNNTEFFGKVDFREVTFNENTFFNSILIDDNGEIDFYMSYFRKNVEFINSWITKSLFQSVFFEQLPNFSGCNLIYTDFSGSVFKEFGLFTSCNIEFANRESFRMVKNELLKLENKIDALKYHEKEMRAYWADLWKSKWHEEIPEKFILFMNHISNGFGLNWVRGIVFTFIVALLFYVPYLFCLGEPYFQWGWKDWTSFWEVSSKTLKYYVEFLYAAHKFDFMEQYKPNGITYALDMIGRIFITYGYYQTIQAFRKYGRW